MFTKVTKRWYRIKYTATSGAIVGGVNNIVSSITSTHASCVKIWNMLMKASAKVSNFVKPQRKQKSCIDILEEMISKHMVKIIRLPNFFPGPKILYTKSSSSGEALINLTTRNTWNLFIISNLFLYDSVGVLESK